MPTGTDNLIAELVSYARTNSPYYCSLYANLPEEFESIESLPITNSTTYWQAANAEPNGVLTGPLVDAVVMQSGGSTSTPKTALFTRQEFHTSSQIGGVLLAQHCGIISGDRIANLSSQGGMYAGFLIYGYAVMNCPIPIVNLPISGKEPLETMEMNITKHKATVIISNVFIATKLANFARQKEVTFPYIRQILTTGESFYADLRPLFKAIFPNARIMPLAYVSTENLSMAYPKFQLSQEEDNDAELDPVYRVVSAAVVLEILDENNVPIKTAGKRGTVVVTNLLKRLQPTIRYPVGDVAEWVDYQAGLIRLRGRSSGSLKIGTAQFDGSLLRRIAEKIVGQRVAADNLQIVLRRRDAQNSLVFRIVSEAPPGAASIAEELEKAIVEANPAWTRNRESGQVGPIEVEWIKFDDLVITENSGKVKELVDQRF